MLARVCVIAKARRKCAASRKAGQTSESRRSKTQASYAPSPAERQCSSISPPVACDSKVTAQANKKEAARGRAICAPNIAARCLRRRQRRYWARLRRRYSARLRRLRARILKHRRRLIASTPTANVAERLRRQTRNLLGSPRAGSNPAVCGHHRFPFL